LDGSGASRRILGAFRPDLDDFLSGSSRITSPPPCHRENGRTLYPVEPHFVASGAVGRGGFRPAARSRHAETVTEPGSIPNLPTIQRIGCRAVVWVGGFPVGSDVTKKS